MPDSDYTWVEQGSGDSIKGTTVLTVTKATEDTVYTCSVNVDGSASSKVVNLEVFGKWSGAGGRRGGDLYKWGGGEEWLSSVSRGL